MNVSIVQISANDDQPDFPWIEAVVKYWDDTLSPPYNVEVTFYLPKDESMNSSQIESRVLRKASEFLARIERSDHS